MNYRYQEMLSWIIPGFYIIIWGLLIAGQLDVYNTNAFRDCLESIKQYNVSNAMAVILVFLIPIISLIFGWIINALAARLFYLHFLQYQQISYGKFVVYKDEKGKYDSLSLIERKNKQEQYFKEYCDAKLCLNLNLIDRTYYRYVFSRNMFASQLLIAFIWFFSSIYIHIECCQILVGTFILVVLSAFYYFVIVSRDLSSHAKFVFAEYRKMEESKQRNNKSNILRKLIGVRNKF